MQSAKKVCYFMIIIENIWIEIYFIGLSDYCSLRLCGILHPAVGKVLQKFKSRRRNWRLSQPEVSGWWSSRWVLSNVKECCSWYYPEWWQRLKEINSFKCYTTKPYFNKKNLQNRAFRQSLWTCAILAWKSTPLTQSQLIFPARRAVIGWSVYIFMPKSYTFMNFDGT